MARFWGIANFIFRQRVFCRKYFASAEINQGVRVVFDFPAILVRLVKVGLPLPHSHTIAMHMHATPLSAAAPMDSSNENFQYPAARQAIGHTNLSSSVGRPQRGGSWSNLPRARPTRPPAKSAILTGSRPSFSLTWKRQATAMTLSSRCLLYTSPSPRDKSQSRMPSSA